MADYDHLKLLLDGGVEAWNRWREFNPKVFPDLRRANLGERNLRWIDFKGVNLNRKLTGANLEHADLSHASMKGVKFSGAVLNFANISYANLTSAKGVGSLLRNTTLIGTDLTDAKLRNANLLYANLNGVDLTRTDLTKVCIGFTALSNLDMSLAKGLDTIRHSAASTVGINTIYRSGGRVSEAFLRGAGVPENFITYINSLTERAFEFYSCFISYSSKDQKFADRLYADLQAKGVRCWFAPEDLRIGDKTRTTIDESIRRHDKLLLVLSKHSVTSDWVEKEVETALEKERLEKRIVLFPIRLENTVMTIESGWAADIRRSRNIGDFRKWKAHDQYQRSLNRLLRDLKNDKSLHVGI